jgi:phosphatidylglycerophosphate synthase
VGRVAQVTLLALAAGLIAARLLANMLDGLVAVEFGQRSPIGELFNEVPDRVSDVFLLVGAGYALSLGTWATVLGWICALLAVGTAYVRLLGGALGFPQDFSGPMAKPQRMTTLIGGCLLSIVEVPLGYAGRVIAATLIVIALGSCVTLVRRTTVIAGKLSRT